MGIKICLLNLKGGVGKLLPASSTIAAQFDPDWWHTVFQLMPFLALADTKEKHWHTVFRFWRV